MNKTVNTMYIKEKNCKLDLEWVKKSLKKINKIKNKNLKKHAIKLLKLKAFLKFMIIYFNQTIKISNIDNDILCIVPIYELRNEMLKKYFQKKLIKRIKNIKEKYEIEYVIFSKNIKENKNLIENLRFLEMKEYNGKKIIKFMINDVIKYIADIKSEKAENQSIYILAKQYNKINVELIEFISRNFKSSYIVTNSVKNFKKLEEKLYSNEGIMIAITNNKEKSLRKAENIINIDFTEEELLKYKINRNCIIINASENILDLGKCFNGIVVNFIKFEKDENKNFFENTEILENYILKYEQAKGFYEIHNYLKKNNLNIEYLVGKRGKIENTEYIKKERISSKNVEI